MVAVKIVKNKRQALKGAYPCRKNTRTNRYWSRKKGVSSTSNRY